MHERDTKQFIIGDCLNITSKYHTDSIDLIYLDPPFNTGKTYKGKEGSISHGTIFKDIWGQGRDAYLYYMKDRLIELHRILKPSGSIYLHCNPKISHYLKIIMDEIFEPHNFINEIIWWYNSGARKKNSFGKRHDTLLLYSKNINNHYFNEDAMREPYSKNINIPNNKAHYYNPKGKVHDDVWRINILAQNDKKERIGFPTQKPLTLLQRIITASCPPDGIVLDPFCGSGTTCIAASILGRKWIGLDISEKSINISKIRMNEITNN